MERKMIYLDDAIDVAKKHWYKPDIVGALAELPSVQLKPKTSESGSVDSEMPEIETDRTTSGDLISRQDAMDGVKTLHDVAWKNWHEPTLSANAVLDMIRELPSAQPELIEKASYVRGFEQGRTQGMIDSQGGQK